MESPKILYADKDLLVVNKPAGMASQPDRTLRPDLVNWLKGWEAAQAEGKDRCRSTHEQGSVGNIYVVHRLDRPVGGVMVYARNQKAAAALSAQAAGKVETGGKTGKAGDKKSCSRMEKEYLAVLTGLPCGGREDGRGHLEAYLSKARGKNQSLVTDQEVPGSAWSALDYEVLEEAEEGALSLVRIRLLTGRRHQIRAMMAHVGAGVWGDTVYNPLFAGKKGQGPLALQAVRLSFTHPSTGKRMDFCVPASAEIIDRFPEAERVCARVFGTEAEQQDD